MSEKFRRPVHCPRIRGGRDYKIRLLISVNVQIINIVRLTRTGPGLRTNALGKKLPGHRTRTVVEKGKRGER